jgi:hypothetical protein
VEAMAKKYGIAIPSKDEWVSTAWIGEINAASMKANGNVEHPEDTISYGERWYWEECEERKRAQARKNGRGRTCGFCGEGGHNARTCEQKKEHIKNCDALRGLAHRTVAACLEKAGIVPGALMTHKVWDYKKSDYVFQPAIVTHINWEQVADAGHKHEQGAPRNFEEWFRNSSIVAVGQDGQQIGFRMPNNLPQQSSHDYCGDHFDGSKRVLSKGLLSPHYGGEVNKDNGWQGDNVTMIDPSTPIYRWGAEIVDKDLAVVVEKLLADVGTKWVNY